MYDISKATVSTGFYLKNHIQQQFYTIQLIHLELKVVSIGIIFYQHDSTLK